MDNKEWFGYLSDIVTVIAFLFAGYQFFLWRKQQSYSLKLDALLNMEDFFEIYMISLMNVHASFDKANRLASESAEKSREEKAKLDSYLKSEFQTLIKEASRETAENQKNYSLARFRVARLGFDVEGKEELNAEWIREKFKEFLIEKNSLEEVAHEISRIKAVAYDHFKVFRGSN